MRVYFEKYQATGNDFVMIDNRDKNFPKKNIKLIAQLCHRKYGIGADGLILIEEAKDANFAMVYFNADGAPGSFCGNGSRAAARYAESLGMIENKGVLMAFDGLHKIEIDKDVIKIGMADVQNGRIVLNGTFIDTGSPHYVEETENVESLNVFKEGKILRMHDQFQPGGSNINFVQRINENQIKVRTFERGVENETLSCGTGVTASALTTRSSLGHHQVEVETLGGILQLKFDSTASGYCNISLIGPAKKVFSGELEI